MRLISPPASRFAARTTAFASAAVLSSATVLAIVLGSLTPPAQGQTPRIVRPDLEIGVQGEPVSELQAVLKLLGFYSGAVSGTFSAETSEAVAQFQQAAGLPATGRVTARTWNRLFPASGTAVAQTSLAQPIAQTPQPSSPPAPPSTTTRTPTVTVPAPSPQSVEAAPEPAPQPAAKPAAKPAPEAPPNPFPILREGAEGDAVVRLQNLLRRLGVFDGAADGDFGPMTLEAVIAAQEKLGLEADGVVGPATWDALKR